MLSAKSKYRSDWTHMAGIKTTIINRTTNPPPHIHTHPQSKFMPQTLAVFQANKQLLHELFSSLVNQAIKRAVNSITECDSIPLLGSQSH